MRYIMLNNNMYSHLVKCKVVNAIETDNTKVHANDIVVEIKLEC